MHDLIKGYNINKSLSSSFVPAGFEGQCGFYQQMLPMRFHTRKQTSAAKHKQCRDLKELTAFAPHFILLPCLCPSSCSEPPA